MIFSEWFEYLLLSHFAQKPSSVDHGKSYVVEQSGSILFRRIANSVRNTFFGIIFWKILELVSYSDFDKLWDEFGRYTILSRQKQ